VGEVTGIEWTDHSWSPWRGCQQVSPACDHCYALALDRRYAPRGSAPPGGWKPGEGPHWGPHAPRVRTAEASWAKVRGWDRAACRAGARRTVFPSLCDPFDNAVDPAWRADFFALMRETPNLVWLLLSKRPGNVVEMAEAAGGLPPNAALGCTVIDQAEADRDVPKLLDAKAYLKPLFAFLSIEPMLGAIDLTKLRPDGPQWIDALRGMTYWWPGAAPIGPAVDWVIAGGESGPDARPAHPDWFRSLRDQCAEAGTPFRFKQWGEWAPVDLWNPRPGVRQIAIYRNGREVSDDVAPQDVGGQRFTMVGKKAAGRLLDGREHNERPAALTREADHG